MTGISGIVYPDSLLVGSQLLQMLQPFETSTQNSAQERFSLCHLGHSGGVLGKSVSSFCFCVLDGFFLQRDKIFSLLDAKGVKLSRKSNDAELSANLFELIGTSFLNEIEGEFALCLYDQKKERILLARDRIGKKPLYWYQGQDHFLFSTKINALLASKIVPSAISLESMASYLFFGYFPQDLSPIKNVSKLLPAHYLYFYLNQSKVIHSYWSYSSQFNTGKQLCLSEAKQLAEQAIKTSAQEHEKIAKKTKDTLLLTPFTGSLLLERALKKEEWTTLKSNEEKSLLEKDLERADLDTLEQIIWVLNEPIADPDIFKWWFLAKNLRERGCKSLCTDIGFAELFTERERYFFPTLTQQNNLCFHLKKLGIRFLLPLANLFWKRKGLLLLKSLRTDPWQFAYLRQNALFQESLIKELAPKLHRFFDPEVFLHKFHHLDRVQGYTASCLYLDVKTRLADSSIPQIEKILNSQKILWTAPFLSRGCIEASARIASSFQSTYPDQSLASLLWPELSKSLYKKQPSQTKACYKKLCSKIILTNSSYLSSGILSESGIVEKAAIKKLLSSPEKLETTWEALFGLLVLEVWMRSFTREKIISKESSLNSSIE